MARRIEMLTPEGVADAIRADQSDMVVASKARPELEFFYFRSAKPEDGVPEGLDEGGYFDLTTLDAGSDLRRESVLQRERLDQLVEGNDEHRAMVSQFERLYDAVEQPGPDPRPEPGGLELRSGDEIAGEIERFLRDQGKS